ncbi:hypothetical protein CHS0354_025591 [Potamilus streckersoni]|uniref:Uncharacterized protein n=1 Tax=Potamilus streckersoni TaxID=2493646 RepID=A0AAE0S1N9_9BIVA|nr:hypothetical protein CHS0354_025591 [Potamilus streckersoni]
MEKEEKIVITTFNLCGILHVNPIQVIDKIKSLQGTYLSLDPSEESYSFGHDSIEHAVFIDYGDFFPERTLLYGPLQLICKRCTIKKYSKPLETTTQDSVLTLQPSYQTKLINRLVTELKGGNPQDFAIVSEATLWSCKDFRKTFLAECKEIHFLVDKDENSLLLHAINAYNRDLVVELLQELDHISETQKGKAAYVLKQSAIASCAHKDIYLLDKICENGLVDVNHILPNSIQHGSIDAIKFLLQSGADINYRSKKGENLIHIACLHGRHDIVRLLHSKRANLVNEFDNNNRSVGHCCATGGSVEILEFLLLLGIDPSYTDATGWNLLHYACWEGKEAMAKHIVDKYPNLLCEEIYEGGGLEMAKYLLKTYPTMLHEVDNSKRILAHNAAHSGNIALLRYLIQRGIDPWCRTSEEETLLHRACINGQLEMTKYLVQTYPTMLYEVDKSKRTPAHNAALDGNVGVLSYLIERGIDTWCRTSAEETLLHRACINGQLEMTK